MGSGNDRAIGGKGHDTAYMGDGNDVFRGKDGNDLARGNHGDDRLEGGAGRDFLIGGSGSDILVGGDGSDILVGASVADYNFHLTGNDWMHGGAGTDLFCIVLYSESDGINETAQLTQVTVRDFAADEDFLFLTLDMLNPDSAEEAHAYFHNHAQHVATDTVFYDPEVKQKVVFRDTVLDDFTLDVFFDAPFDAWDSHQNPFGEPFETFM